MLNTKLLKHCMILAVVGSAAALNTTARAENTNRANAEAACQSGDVILCENWEDNDWNGWTDYTSWDAESRGGRTCAGGGCAYSVPGYNNSRATLIRLPANDRDGIYPKGRFNTMPGPNDTLYARWRVQWSPNFEFNVTNTKNFYLITDAASGGGAYRVGFFSRPESSTANLTRGLPYIHLYCNQIEVQAGSWQERDCHDSGGDLRLYPNQPNTSGFRLVGGQWYEIQMRITPNPVGQRFGGRIQYWINGQLMADYYNDNVSIRKANESDSFDGVWLSSYFGGGSSGNHPAQTVTYDDIIVSRSFIGSGSGGGGSAPAPAVAPPSSPVLRLN